MNSFSSGNTLMLVSAQCRELSTAVPADLGGVAHCVTRKEEWRTRSLYLGVSLSSLVSQMHCCSQVDDMAVAPPILQRRLANSKEEAPTVSAKRKPTLKCRITKRLTLQKQMAAATPHLRENGQPGQDGQWPPAIQASTSSDSSSSL